MNTRVLYRGFVAVAVFVLFTGCEESSKTPKTLENQYGDEKAASSDDKKVVEKLGTSTSTSTDNAGGADLSGSSTPLPTTDNAKSPPEGASPSASDSAATPVKLQPAGEALAVPQPEAEPAPDPRLERLKKQVGDKQFEAAYELCKAVRFDSSPEYKSVCEVATKAYYQQLNVRLFAARDGFSDVDTRNECRTLLTLAGPVDPLSVMKITTLCKELDVSIRLGEAKREVESGLKQLSAVTPYQCKVAERALNDLQSEWAAVAKKMFEETCSAYPERLVTAFEEGWANARRDPQSRVVSWSCLKLSHVEEALSVDDKKRVKALCAEVEGERYARKALKDVPTQLKSDAPLMPFGCANAIASLREAETPWAQSRAKAVVSACYVELGKHMLERYPQTKHMACRYSLKKWFQEGRLIQPPIEPLTTLLGSVEARCGNQQQ